MLPHSLTAATQLDGDSDFFELSTCCLDDGSDFFGTIHMLPHSLTVLPTLVAPHMLPHSLTLLPAVHTYHKTLGRAGGFAK